MNITTNYKREAITERFNIDLFLFDEIEKEADANNPKKANGITDFLILTNGDSINLYKYKGKYILLDFWFVNCRPCMMGIPKVNAIYEKFKDKKFIVLGINPVDKNMKAINDVAAKRTMKYPVCRAPIAYEKYFGVEYFPTYILLSPDQKSFKPIKLDSDAELEIFMKEMDKKLN